MDWPETDGRAAPGDPWSRDRAQLRDGLMTSQGLAAVHRAMIVPGRPRTGHRHVSQAGCPSPVSSVSPRPVQSFASQCGAVTSGSGRGGGSSHNNLLKPLSIQTWHSSLRHGFGLSNTQLNSQHPAAQPRFCICQQFTQSSQNITLHPMADRPNWIKQEIWLATALEERPWTLTAGARVGVEGIGKSHIEAEKKETEAATGRN